MAKLHNTSFAYSLSFQLFSAQGIFQFCLSVDKLTVDTLLRSQYEVTSKHLSDHEAMQTFLPPQHSLSWSPSNLWPVAGGIINFWIFLNLPHTSFVWLPFYQNIMSSQVTIHVLYANYSFVNLSHILPSCLFQAEELLMNVITNVKVGLVFNMCITSFILNSSVILFPSHSVP